MNLQKRYYQDEAVNAILSEWAKGNQKTLLCLPTGTGKTIVFCMLIEVLVRVGERVLILAHRGELLDQAADKLSKTTGLGCAVEKAENSCLEEWDRVVVGSVQSLTRPKRLEQFAPDYFHTIIVDEAHHCLAESYLRVLNHFQGAKVLGVTATPDRGDMRNLGEFFNSLAYEYSLAKAIKDKFLAPIKALSIPLKIDISGVAIQSGDYQAAALGTALDPYLEQIAEVMLVHCKTRKTVVFLPLIATSQKFCEILRRKGFKAVEVNGESDDRAQVLRDWERGRYDVLCNSMLLIEGWDSPHTDCIIALRPTKIRSLFSQMIGRGTRLYPGKDHLLILDFLWITSRLDLCRPACLIAQDAEVAEQMTLDIQASGKPVDIMDAEAQAESSCMRTREEKLADELEKMRKKKQQLVDPLQYAISICDLDLSQYKPAFGFEEEPPSAIQKSELEKFGIHPDVESAGYAEKLLKSLRERQDNGLSSGRQIRILEQKGFQHVATWDFEVARKMINRIAANGWRVPKGVVAETYQPKNQERKLSA